MTQLCWLICLILFAAGLFALLISVYLSLIFTFGVEGVKSNCLEEETQVDTGTCFDSIP